MDVISEALLCALGADTITANFLDLRTISMFLADISCSPLDTASRISNPPAPRDPSPEEPWEHIDDHRLSCRCASRDVTFYWERSLFVFCFRCHKDRQWRGKPTRDDYAEAMRRGKVCSPMWPCGRGDCRAQFAARDDVRCASSPYVPVRVVRSLWDIPEASTFIGHRDIQRRRDLQMGVCPTPPVTDHRRHRRNPRALGRV